MQSNMTGAATGGLSACLIRGLRTIRNCETGNLSVEFALVLPILLLLGLGVFDSGRMLLEQLRITSAAQAAVQYAVQDPSTAADLSGIAQAARNDARDAVGLLTVTARQYCSCSADGEVACGSSCSDGDYSRRYIEVVIEDEFTPLFDYPVLPDSIRLQTTKSMRIN